MRSQIFSFMAVTLLAIDGNISRAAIYTDATYETNINSTFVVFDHLDLTKMEVTNDSTDIIFTLSVRAANITTPDWGKYCIGIDSVSGGDTNGNGWGRPIKMSSGMDYWIGSWVDGV